MLPKFYTLFISILFTIVGSINLSAQQNTPRKYAVVVGISEYKNPQIPKLKFAHIDASKFVEFLKSNAGGNIPDSNIVLLQNNKATYTAVYNAMDWLIENAKENDIVYFYFSGHGDMENTTLYKLGFLLAYNTPHNNYINNAIRIEDLNNYANTLSLKTKAKVILITDACHSGTLAGNDNRGSFLVGEQLRTVLNNEVRIASCNTDELSAEDKSWGGGRGVFSYYLLNGLIGLADEKKDGKIYIDEISTYLNKSLGSDIILKERNHKQTPIVKGSTKFQLAVVDTTSLTKLNIHQQNNANAEMQNDIELPPLNKSLQSHFFDMIATGNIEEKIYFPNYTNLTPDMISETLIKNVAEKAKDVQTEKKLEELAYEIKKNSSIKNKFNRKLIEVISDRGQEIINAYLNGDEAELERRRYYNNINNEFYVYPSMFDIATKLCEPSSPLKKILQLKKSYFTAVYHRLQALKEIEYEKELEKAKENILEAIALDKHAAYLHNELGIIYKMQKDYINAEKSFLLAIKIAPSWTIPYSNLSGTYFIQKNYVEAEKQIEKAEKIQPELFYVLLNRGRIFENKSNYLFAEEKYRNSINKNSRHYFPFERLGYVYTAKGNYLLADSFFYEAELRKKGLNYIGGSIDGDGNVDASSLERHISKCDIPSEIDKKDVITPFVLGLYHSYSFSDTMYNTVMAEYYFKMAIERDNTNPLAFHYLGKLYWQKQDWQKANEYFRYAINNYLTKENLERYADSLAKYITIDKKCYLNRFKESYYNKEFDYYFLGDGLTKWHHYDEAEQQYIKVISFDSNFVGGYFKLWNLYELQGKYIDAENTVQHYANRNNKLGLMQLNAFYERVVKTGLVHWFYKAGLHFYNEVSKNPSAYNEECISNLPSEEIDKNCIAGIAIVQEHLASRIPGTNEYVEPGIIFTGPKQKAIDNFLLADKLLALETEKADVNNKIGDMYVLLKSPRNAAIYYKKSFDYKNDNSSCALKLVNVLNTTYQFELANKTLDTIHARNELDCNNLFLNLHYKIFSNNLTKVPNIINAIDSIIPVHNIELARNKGFYYLFKNEFSNALTSFENYLEAKPNNADVLYDLARLHVLHNKKDAALSYLEKSIRYGFKHSLVLKYDVAWNDYRNSDSFLKIIGSIKQ